MVMVVREEKKNVIRRRRCMSIAGIGNEQKDQWLNFAGRRLRLGDID